MLMAKRFYGYLQKHSPVRGLQKKMLLEFRKTHKEIPVPESIF